MRVASAGTHPFSNWADQKIFPDPRYDKVVEEMQQLARANLIFGLHVHVGIKDRSLAFQIMNEALYFLPHLLALSTNSPFWLGRNTGLKSYRTKIFDRFPRTSMPEYFETPEEFDAFVRILVKTNSIDNGKKIWWDVRPHPFFETIEFRVCDVPMRLDETITIAALIQAICVKLYRLRIQNLGFRRYRRALILENKWRASRYGIEGKLIDFGKEIEVPFRDLIAEMLEFLDDVVDELGSRKEVERVNWILENGTGADRQLRVYEATGGDLKKVVDYICEETSYGLPVEAPIERAAPR
jgi:carboxylate-amine ligase